MELKQKTEFRKLLLPGLRLSLKILPLSLPDLKTVIDDELQNNPFLEETTGKNPKKIRLSSRLSGISNNKDKNIDFSALLAAKKPSLRELLLRELGLFAKNEIECKIGEEIIGNIDENGYLRANLEEIAAALSVPLGQTEAILKLIQQFEPAGVAARTVSECLLLQLESNNECNPLIRKIIERHLTDMAKKKYAKIAKVLNQPLGNILPLLKKILELDPKPGRNYSLDEISRIIPDIILYEKNDGFEITINDEDIPHLKINQTYAEILKNASLPLNSKTALTDKLYKALEFLNAISKRQTTLRRIVEIIVEIQEEAIKKNLSFLKPLTIKKIAQRLHMHESTISRAIINKFIELPFGTIRLKDLLSGSIQEETSNAVSANYVKGLLQKIIAQEDKKRPLSDQKIYKIFSTEKRINIKRRTITKYRQELKILPSAFRKEL